MKRLVTLATGLMLLLAIGAFAQGTAKAPAKAKTKAAVTMHQASGTISSVEADKLVLSHKVKGKEEETTFMLNDQTKREGELKAGEKATVHYKVENGQDMATMVKASAPKMASTKKK